MAGGVFLTEDLTPTKVRLTVADQHFLVQKVESCVKYRVKNELMDDQIISYPLKVGVERNVCNSSF